MGDDAPVVEVQQSHFVPLLSWQRSEWQRLTQRWPNLPHGLLLSGTVGTGKRRFADRLTAWLLCEARSHMPDGACGRCVSCQWLRAGTHPNLLRISREVDAKGKQSKQIKIDQIRGLLPFVQQTSDGWRVVIIEPAEAMNMAAANALLKTLEEPSANVLLLLVADQPLQLPATIRSRVQQLPLGRIDRDQACTYVQDEAQVNAAHALVLLGLAGHAPLAAVALAGSEMVTARADWVADWQALCEQRADVLSVSARWQKRLPFTDFLALIAHMLRDVIALHLGQPVVQTDLSLDALQQTTQLPALLALSAQWPQLMQAQAQNVQVGLVCDSFIKQLAAAGQCA
ncbi:MAG: polymerase subunit delta [Pseudomonadota bacterium]|jgi:DNA polymerase-3 subunit delta'